jgi:polysaccharide biosynthesis/export protein
MQDQRSGDLRRQRRARSIGVRCALFAFACAAVALAQDQPRQAPLIDANTANLPAQRIGASDLIAISVYGSPELTRTVRVGADGLVRLPMLAEPIKAQGRMPSELEGVIADALKRGQLLVDPLVTVTVVEYQSRPISVMGAVRKPLTFQATGPLTLLEALSKAEGLSPDAGSEVLVSKPGAAGAESSLVRRIPVKALLADSNPEMNLRLTGGEEIRVPTAEKIFVVGNVKRSGAFAIGEDAGTSVLKAVALAEGLMPYAAKQAVIYRKEAAGSVNEVPVEIGKIMARKSPDVALLPNDVLYIPEAKASKVGWATVERLLLFGSGAATAMIYGAAVH